MVKYLGVIRYYINNLFSYSSGGVFYNIYNSPIN